MIASVVRVFGPLLCVAGAVLLASTASAGNAGEPPEYRGVIGEALAEFEAGHFAEARALFAQAHRAYPSARTLRGLGLSSFELREYRAAIDYLQAAIDSDVNPLDPALRTATEEVIVRARGFIGRYTLTIAPAHAELRLDGISIARPSALSLELGPHVLDASAPGYAAERVPLHVLGGENTHVAITLTPIGRPVVETTAMTSPADTSTPLTTRDRETPAPLYRNGWLWVGIGMVAVAVSVAVGVTARWSKPIVGGVTETDNTPPGGVLSTLIAGPQR